MFGSLRLFLVPLVALGALALAPMAQASKAAGASAIGTTGVRDGAKLFSKEAVEKADKKIASLVRDSNRGLLIETLEQVPPRLRDRAAKKETRRAALQELAAERYKDEKVGGVYLLIVKRPPSTQPFIGDRALNAGFTSSIRKAWVEAVNGKLKERDFDGALAAGVEQVEKAYKEIGRDVAKSGTASTAPRPQAASSAAAPMSIINWIIIGVVALVVLWLVVGLLRAFSGVGSGGGSGAGSGAAMSAGGGGGGGGGFLTSMLGGLFGAAAGMWVYNSFFGGNSGGWGTSSAYGHDTSSTNLNNPGASREEGGSAAGGEDWGDDAKADAGQGGDDGGGGGDWGGGGDDGGGGGDWGGGGDDGGGGGDW